MALQDYIFLFQQFCSHHILGYVRIVIVYIFQANHHDLNIPPFAAASHVTPLKFILILIFCFSLCICCHLIIFQHFVSSR